MKTIKIYVINGKEIEAKTLEEAKAQAKVSKAKTFQVLKEEANTLANKLQKEIIEVAKELGFEEYKTLDKWGEKVVIEKMGFEIPKNDKESPTLHYLEEVGTTKKWANKYKLYFYKSCDNTLKRTKCYIGKLLIIDATTKQDYQEYIDNFELHKKETIKNLRNWYIEPTIKLMKEYKEDQLKVARRNKQELITKYQENLDFLKSLK